MRSMLLSRDQVIGFYRPVMWRDGERGDAGLARAQPGALPLPTNMGKSDSKYLTQDPSMICDTVESMKHDFHSERLVTK